jgi:hypothetical protein
MKTILTKANNSKLSGSRLVDKYGSERISLLLSRIRNKKPNQLVRTIFTRVPPFSLFGRGFYKALFQTRLYGWRNKTAISLYQNDNQQLDKVQQATLEKLNKDGVAILHLDDLSSDRNLLGRLKANARCPAVLQAEKLSGQTLYNHKIRGIGRNIKGKHIPEAYLDFFLSDKLLNIINSYFGLRTRLNYIDAWYSLPVDPNDLFVTTELWHRDHEDKRIIKVFVYLSEVAKDMGPFSYINGTHSKGQGKFTWLAPSSPPRGVYLRAGDIERVQQIDRHTINAYPGKPGSVIIADTSGFHKGGRAIAEPRHVLVAFFATDAAVDRHSYSLPPKIDPGLLSPQACYALGLNKSE